MKRTLHCDCCSCSWACPSPCPFACNQAHTKKQSLTSTGELMAVAAKTADLPALDFSDPEMHAS